MTAYSVEHLVVGAGPAGLRAAQVLAEAGREVLVAEKNAEVGPKTCGGGLTIGAVRELDAMGLPPEVGRHFVASASFLGEEPTHLDTRHAAVRTLSRRSLGQFQLGLTRAAGAEVWTGAAASQVDLATRTLSVGGKPLRYRHLIGADGSASVVRRALRLPSPRVLFAGEFNIAGLEREHLYVAFDSTPLASGYFWEFPHQCYTSIGAGVHRTAVAPGRIKPYLEGRLAALGLDPGDTPFEGATIEIECFGLHFSNDVHLAGDAAGIPSGFTAEGIYPALISGEEVARRILEPTYPSPKTRSWLRIKRVHDWLGRQWLKRGPREVSLRILRAACDWPLARRWLSALFVPG